MPALIRLDQFHDCAKKKKRVKKNRWNYEAGKYFVSFQNKHITCSISFKKIWKLFQTNTEFSYISSIKWPVLRLIRTRTHDQQKKHGSSITVQKPIKIKISYGMKN